MSNSDAQQNREGELKQAFQKHLPHRISAVQRRLTALCELGWDINTLHLTYLEIQNLAGASGSYGLVEVSNKLFSLEEFLAGFLTSGDIPNPKDEEQLHRLLVALKDYGDLDAEAREARRIERELQQLKIEPLPAPEVDMSGLPALANIVHFIRPPAGFVPESPAEVLIIPRADEPRFGAEGDEEFMIADDGGEITVGDLGARLVGEDHLFDDFDDFKEPETEEGADMRLEFADDAIDEAIDESADQSTADRFATGPEDEYEELEELFEEVESDLGGEPASPEPQSERATVDTSAAEAAREEKPTIYFLRGNDETSRHLAVLLEDDHEIQAFTDSEEFMEILSAIGPDAVIVDDAHLDCVDEIGPIVRKLRAKTHDQLPLIALSPQRDVATRLNLMRAGADAFLSANDPIDEIANRVTELVKAKPEEPYRVLIVEDDNSQAVFAQSILQRAGMVARTEADPLKVIDVMEDFRPDLILMDLHMPGCDGMELTAIIRERPEFVNTPIVFLSGEEDEDTHFDALLAGGDDFLSKPIRPRHLVSAVKNRVTRARAMSGRAVDHPTAPDSVTGLVDRPVLLDKINTALVDFNPQNEDRAGGVIYYEIDRPYDVRRELGLPAFESLSSQLGPLLTENLRADDVAARYGDNAYCILVPNRSLTALQRRAQATLDRVADHQFSAGVDDNYSLTVSAGICPLSVEFADAASVIGAAERVCNGHAETGPRRLGVHRQDGEAPESDEVREIGALITDALDHNRFQLVFQPIASLQGEEVEQYHCLLRLPRDDAPTMPPMELLQAAEDLGMLDQIDRWVLKKALAVLAGSGQHSKVLRLFVNQSLAATQDRDLPEWLMNSMESRKVPGTSLVMEFKLPEIANSLKSAVEFRQALSPRRIRFCLGQFDGTNTAFEILNHFPAEFVKLSVDFLSEHREDGEIDQLTRRLHESKAMVIAPAVEDARSAVSLWSSGVDYIQGHFVQQPESQLSYNFVNPV